jgi:non-ribosomal peptide synthetase component F
VSAIEIITDEEKQQLLYEFNNTQSNYPKEKSLPHIIEEITSKQPDNIAIIYKDQQISYSKLN